MMFLGKKIITFRGESFTLGFAISKEYNGFELPYFAQAGIQNPHYLLQIRNTEFYEKDKGSIYNYWIPCKIIKVQDGELLKNCNLICSHGNPVLYDTNEQTVIGNRQPKQDDLVYGIDNQQQVNFMIYDGSKPKRITDVYPWTMFKKTLHPIDARRFVQGTWWYELFLVSGDKTIDYLNGTYKSFFLDGMNVHEQREFDKYGKCAKWLYDKICSLDKSFENKVAWDRPLMNYVTVDKISKPEKFIVR